MRHRFPKGYTPWNKGKRCPHISKARKGVSPWNKGKKLNSLPEEHRKKISKSLIGKNNWSQKEKHPKWKGGVSFDKQYRNHQIGEWKKRNKDKISFYSAKRRIRKIDAGGFHTIGEWELLKKQYDYTCPSCGEKEPEIKLTEDHIVPVSRGGSDNIENIQPLCSICNCCKFTKVIKYA